MKMKRILTLFGSVALVLGLSGVAAAVPYEWTDVVDPGDVYFSSARQGGVRSYTFVHQIWDGDDGFAVGQDVVDSYSLTIALYDDARGDGSERVRINLPGRTTDGIYEVNFTDVELGFSVQGLAMLNTTGELEVRLRRLAGDFYFGDSTLVVSGDRVVPVSAVSAVSAVPEPASLLLLGGGLLGLAALGRRKLLR